MSLSQSYQMETHHDDDQTSQEKGTSNDDQQQQEAATSLVRSYDCTFCERGFSNAQALGGHMNIHRKDKAYKRKQAAASISNNSNQQSFNISKIRASYSQIPTIRPSSMEVVGSTQERSFAAKTDKTQLAEARKLPSFVERSPPLKIDQRAANSSEEEEDLDLELRLGPEPHQDSSTSAITGTKKFF